MNVIQLAQMLEFSQRGDERGHLVVVEGHQDIPFDIKHLRYIQYEYTPRGMKKFEEELEKHMAIASVENLSDDRYY